MDYAVLTQIPSYADAATLSVYVQYPNPAANVWRYYSLSTLICNPQPPYCPPGQICEIQVQQRQQQAASGGATGQEVAVFPNPADAFMTLDLAVPTATPTTVSIKDMLGRTLHIQQVAPGQRMVSLDVSQLPAGSFIVTIATTSGTTAKRIQISR
ncbi:T9SS type A sorting domain-containing protein [Hymenobacter endophyticus]|uniref:T9SS type A sorting domain-containing protein n=1 Tax=Hymenobacter endophyticus TaxID=3076335 RepID=UPI0036180A3F